MPESAASAPFNILCVDDEPNILSALRRALRPGGYQVRVATSGTEALEVLAQEAIDLVISDMRMPNMDGAQFLAAVRQRHPDVIRILLTGYADMSSTIDAINRGEIYRYLSKPWDDGEILEVLASALERKSLEREKARLEALTRTQNEELKTLNASLEDKVRERTAELAQANERLKCNFLTSVQIFASLIEMRHPALAGHSRRVAATARKIAQKMGMNGRETQDVFVAGLLHDIGKIGLSDDLITTPVNRMSGDKLGAWRKHASQGQTSLMALEDLREVARLVRLHHERFDGQGFPDGLSGMEIPLGARILAAANDLDSFELGLITGTRHSADDALKLILSGRGSRYDPAVVAALAEQMHAPVREAVDEIHISPNKLVPGMVLARDLIGRDGVLLLTTDYLIDESLVRQIRDYEEKEDFRLSLYVRSDRRGS
ncbi:HD domain-containing phosphohydrolase [Niveibacterium terrae]|uniref:HD domain-containing phosphohydrolase n=1 Tax=Niveibacterium terrae TaxID=3373598 RepID=UPI003A8D6BE8